MVTRQYLIVAVLLAAGAAGLCAQEKQPAAAQSNRPPAVAKEQWEAIRAAEQAKDYPKVKELQEKIIADKALALRDRLSALAGYYEHARQKQAADPQQAAAWIEEFSRAPDHDGESFHTLTVLKLKQAENDPDAQRREEIMRAAVNSSLLSNPRRCEFAGQLAKAYLLRTDDTQGAVKIARDLLALPGMTEADVFAASKALGDLWKMIGNMQEAIAAYELIYQKAPTRAEQATKLIQEAYMYFGEPAKAKAHFMQHASQLDKAKEDRAFALQLLGDEKTNPGMKKELFKLFLSNTKEDAAVRAKFAAVVADKTLVTRDIGGLGLGSYEYALEILGYGENSSAANSTGYALNKIKALAGLNRYDELRSYLAEFLARPKCAAKPQEKYLLALVDGVIGLPDQAGVAKAAVAKVNAASEVYKELSPAEQGKLLVQLASIVTHSRKNTLARDVYGLSEALYVPQPRKTVQAVFFNEPVAGFEAFLKVKDTLKPELLDRKFGGDLKTIVATDIAAGAERAGALAAKDTTVTYGKLYVLCDPEGVSFFFDIPDPDGLELGAGLAQRKHTFELYFAPGWNQPYFATGTRYGGVSGDWFYQTSYNNLTQTRYDQTSSDFKQDVLYYDRGFYAVYFFSWNAMFDKLPDAPEKFCEFDNIDWSPNGGWAWSLRLNVHSRLEWGRVYFNFKPEQLDRIRQEIIFKARKDYLAERDRFNGPVDFWKDDVIGDPAFYAAKVRPLVERLDAYLPRVKTEMAAAEIDELYRDAVPGWKKLGYLISAMRTRYVEDRLTAE